MTRTWRAAAAAVAIASLAAACSSSGESSSPTTTAAPTTTSGSPSTSGSPTTSASSGSGAAAHADPAAYCDAILAVETAGVPDFDFETATPDEITAAVKAFGSDVMLPLAREVEETAPEAIAEPVAALVEATEEMAATGDGSVFEAADAAAAEREVLAYNYDHCGWEEVAFSTVDYSFEGLPTSLSVGPTAFTFTNEGTEVHEIVLVRRHEGVTETVEELLSLPDEEAFEKVTMVGMGGPVEPGGSSHVVADLEAGSYIAVCFVPVGAMAMDGPPPEGPPHAMTGMVTEITVS